ncbi:hypothetical protein ABT282_31075 [Streptomyces sp. NPDC000927]|uniref:hypothetical protein n=1 Tax=Streptomyces sp. NPDC000927 TaxID=3154371 RepID=UPI003316FDD9
MFGGRLEIGADIDLDGSAYRITMPRPPGSEACLWALIDDWRLLVPGGLPEEQRSWWEDFLSDPESQHDWMVLRPAAFSIAKQVYGVPWWAAHRILKEAAEAYLSYQMWCVAKGFRPTDEPADRIVASAVAWISSQWTEESQAKTWQQATFMPPSGVKP